MRTRLNAAGRGIAILFFGLLLAALLQAEGLRKQAQIQPAGFQRHLALDATRPLLSVSRTLHLTTPRHELQAAIGRGNEDRIDAQVHLSLPPPAGPLPKRRHVAKPARRRAPTRVAAPRPRFPAAKPLRLWVAGDSLAQIPGQ